MTPTYEEVVEKVATDLHVDIGHPLVNGINDADRKAPKLAIRGAMQDKMPEIAVRGDGTLYYDGEDAINKYQHFKTNCTIPEVLHIRHWFEKNFGKCCRVHDERYENPRAMTRRSIDAHLLSCMLMVSGKKRLVSRTFVYKPFSYLTYAFVRCVGWMHFGK